MSDAAEFETVHAATFFPTICCVSQCRNCTEVRIALSCTCFEAAKLVCMWLEQEALATSTEDNLVVCTDCLDQTQIQGLKEKADQDIDDSARVHID